VFLYSYISLLVQAAWQAAARGERVLITAPSNLAVSLLVSLIVHFFICTGGTAGGGARRARVDHCAVESGCGQPGITAGGS